MTDPRIPQLVRATRKMRAGDFHVHVTPACPGPAGAAANADPDGLDQLATELQALSNSLEQRFGQLRALARVTERANAGLLLDQVCDQVYDSFRGLIPFDHIGLALLEDNGQIARARWARSESEHISMKVGYAAPMRASSLQTIIRTGQPRILNDLNAYLRQHPASDATRRMLEEGVVSSLTCPLVAQDTPVGFLFFSSFHTRTYEQAHVAIFQAIAGQLSMIVEKSRIYQELVQLDGFKSRMLGMAAHDLRNPLSLILTSLELLE